MTQTIYCDEAGFTGPNLSDKDQPYFVYTALALAPQIATDILGNVNRHFRLGGSEIKGNKLVKSQRGREALSNLLDQCAPKSKSVVINKKYALACKLYEYIFEPPLSDKSGIFYALGFHKFVSTLLFAEITLKDNSAEHLLHRFEELMRTRGSDGIVEFFGQRVAQRRTRSVAKEVAAFAQANRIAIIDELNEVETLGGFAKWTLDLTSTALNSLLCYWGDKFDQLDVFCDDSKPLTDLLAESRSPFSAMVGRTDKQYIDIDGEKRPLTFNLVRPVTLRSSKDEPGLQIADAIASSLSYALKHRREQISSIWLKKFDDSSAIHSESIMPDAANGDASTPRGLVNKLLFRELVKRSRNGIHLLDGIEGFLRFPYEDAIRESRRNASRELRRERAPRATRN